MSHRITLAAGLALVALLACSRLQSNDKLLADARQYRAAGDLRAAVIQLKNAIQQQPEDGAARQLLGEVYVEQGDAVSAEKELRRAMDRGRSRAGILPALGKAMLLQGAHERLLGELAADPEQPAVLALRGEAYLGLGQPDQAAPLFRQALQHQPDCMDALLGLARLALSRKQEAEAMRYVEQAIAAQPKEIGPLRFKADLLRMQGQAEAARQAYEGILKQHPNNVQARLDLASLALQAGQREQARAQIAAARKSQPNSLAVTYGQAMLDYT
jgi:putative PEP-CTERM system TPR-repeat lipoprotein